MSDSIKAAILGGIMGAAISAAALIYTNNITISANKDIKEIELTLRYKHELYGRFAAALDKQVHMAMDRKFNKEYGDTGALVKDTFWEIEPFLKNQSINEAQSRFSEIRAAMDTYQNGATDQKIKEKENSLREYLRDNLFKKNI